MWELYNSRRKKDCTLEFLSVGKYTVFSGEWAADIQAAIHVFSDSGAWRSFGFYDWMQDYTMVHYAFDDDQMEGEPIAIEVLVRDNDNDEKESNSCSTDWTAATALAHAGLHPWLAVQEKDDIAWEKTCREAQDLF